MKKGREKWLVSGPFKPLGLTQQGVTASTTHGAIPFGYRTDCMWCWSSDRERSRVTSFIKTVSQIRGRCSWFVANQLGTRTNRRRCIVQAIIIIGATSGLAPVTLSKNPLILSWHLIEITKPDIVELIIIIGTANGLASHLLWVKCHSFESRHLTEITETSCDCIVTLPSSLHGHRNSWAVGHWGNNHYFWSSRWPGSSRSQ